MMKKSKRILGILLTVTLIAGSSATAFADTSGKKPEASKVVAHLMPDITVTLLDEVQVFKDAGGKVIYPIVYKGTTYLPVRAISTLMKQNIEWDAKGKIVFIGRTLTDPSKIAPGPKEPETGYVDLDKPDASLITVHLKPDVSILYDFKTQNFVDANGSAVYPIIYQGSTYLPIRAISRLMNEPVEWDPTTKTVAIGDVKKQAEEDLLIDSQATVAMKKAFEEEVALYDQATAKISQVHKGSAADQLARLAAGISEDYLKAQSGTAFVKAMDTAAFTELEKTAYASLCEFMESAEYYILVMENIAYIAAGEGDYSVFAETFLNFAMDSSAKLDQARRAIYWVEQAPSNEGEKTEPADAKPDAADDAKTDAKTETAPAPPKDETKETPKTES